MLRPEVVQSKFQCVSCNKTYARKSSFEKHRILCNFRCKSKREIQVETEESADIPKYVELVKIVQELTMKMDKMESQMIEMQKFIDKKKKKINIISWLNANITPTVGFLEWVKSSLTASEKHFEDLMENTLYTSFQQVFEDNLKEQDNFIYPIKCFTQKNNTFYICENQPDGTPNWRLLELSDMTLLLKTVQNLLIRVLTKWKLDNKQKISDNDRLSDTFNKAIIKLMNISFTQDSVMSKIKNGLYNYLKTDLKFVMDYEFDFNNRTQDV